MPRARLHNVQVLRFLAAVSVQFGHAQHEVTDLGIATTFARFDPIRWAIGVDVFFVISGFVMYYQTADRFGSAVSSGDFLRRRLVRIVPTYWLFTALMVVAGFLFSSAVAHHTIAIPHLLASLAFYPWPNSDGWLLPVLMPGWTLNYEMFFYLLFALALLLPRRAGCGALITGFAALAAVHPFIDPAWIRFRFWTEPIILEFPVGMVLGMLYVRGVRLGRWAWVVMLAGVALMLALRDVALRPVAFGLPAALIVAGAALTDESPSRGRLRRVLRLGGDASYAIYLCHPFAITATGLVWRALVPGWPWPYVTAASLASIAGGIMIYWVLEKPLLRALAPRRAAGASVASRGAIPD